jgi:hypothetical protein
MKDRILNAIKLTIPIVVVISVAYEFFYFIGMGWRLSQAPLNTQDFIRGWLVWGAVLLPLLSGSLTTFTFFTATPLDPNNQQPAPKTEAQARIHELKQRLIRVIFWGCVAIGATLLLRFIVEGEYRLYVLQTSFLFFGLSGLVRMAFITVIPKFDTFLKMMALGLLSFFSLVGFEDGTNVLDGEFRLPNTATLQTTRISGVDETVIRVFDQWTLIRQSPRHYAWINHQSGETIEFQAWRKRYQGVRCIFNEDTCYYDKRESDSFK